MMRSSVSVTFANTSPLTIDLDGADALSLEEARAWLDEQFTRMECEPLRPTGKLLTADKVVVVAQAAGLQKFREAAWARDFARAASAALGRPLVNIDVPSLSISY